MFVCICKSVTEEQVRALAREGLSDPERMAIALGLHDDECCGRCRSNMDRVMAFAEPSGAGSTR